MPADKFKPESFKRRNLRSWACSQKIKFAREVKEDYPWACSFLRSWHLWAQKNLSIKWWSNSGLIDADQIHLWCIDKKHSQKYQDHWTCDWLQWWEHRKFQAFLVAVHFWTLYWGMWLSMHDIGPFTNNFVLCSWKNWVIQDPPWWGSHRLWWLLIFHEQTFL